MPCRAIVRNIFGVSSPAGRFIIGFNETPINFSKNSDKRGLTENWSWQPSVITCGFSSTHVKFLLKFIMEFLEKLASFVKTIFTNN